MEKDRVMKTQRAESEIQKFYGTLSNKAGMYYIFYTTGLLPFVIRALEGLDPYDNIALISSNLLKEERNFADRYFPFPAVHINDDVDDKIIWNALIKTNEYDFGWIDCDTFIIDTEIFNQLLSFKADTVINGYWDFKFYGNNFVNTYLMTINAGLIKKIPCTFDLYTDNRIVFPREKYAIRQPGESFKAIADIYPLGLYPLGHVYDTSTFLQAYAHSKGYKTERIEFQNPMAGHCGGCYIIAIIFKDKICFDEYKFNFHSLTPVLFGRALIDKYRHILPPSYRDFKERLDIKLEECNQHVVNATKKVLKMRRLPADVINLVGIGLKK